MAHRLAVMAGEVDVDQLVSRLPHKQFQRWQMYYELEPFGPRRDNYHAAVVARAIYTAHGVKKKDGGEFSYEDFLLDWKPAPPKRRQTVEEQKAIARIYALAFNAPGRN